jgi:hypothetical protein
MITMGAMQNGKGWPELAVTRTAGSEGWNAEADVGLASVVGRHRPTTATQATGATKPDI